MPLIRPLAVTFALAAAPLAAAPLAAATPADLEPAFANTIVSTYPDGRSARLWLNRDGSYRAQGRRGRYTGGRWNLKGDQLCLRQSRPVFVPFTYCSAVVAGGVGTRWSGRAPTGEPISIQLVAGRAGLVP